MKKKVWKMKSKTYHIAKDKNKHSTKMINLKTVYWYQVIYTAVEEWISRSYLQDKTTLTVKG
jgi:hypothetical protein